MFSYDSEMMSSKYYDGKYGTDNDLLHQQSKLIDIMVG